MKQRISSILLVTLLTVTGMPVGLSGPVPSWPAIWQQFNPPVELDTVVPGRSEGTGTNDSLWVYLSGASDLPFAGAPDGYSGDVFILSAIGKGIQNGSMHGAAGYLRGNANLYFESGNYQSTYGGFGQAATVTGNTNVTVAGGVFGQIGQNGWEAGRIFGGGQGTDADVAGNATVAMTGGAVYDIHGGGHGANIVGGDARVSVSGDNTKILAHVYGGGVGESDSCVSVVGGSTHVVINLTNVLDDYEPSTMDPGTTSGSIILGYVYGGGDNYSTVKGDTNVTIEDGSFRNHVMAGSAGGLVEGDAHLIVNNGTFGREGDQASITVGGGGGNMGRVDGNASVMINGGTFHSNVSIMGSSSKWSEISGNTSVVIAGGTISGDVVGGGSSRVEGSRIGGNSSVLVKGGMITGDIYAGSSVAANSVSKDAYLIFKGNDWTVTGHLYGGEAQGLKVLELSGMSTAFKDKVAASSVSGFDLVALANGTRQDIADLETYGLKVEVRSGATLTWKDTTSSPTIAAHLNQGGYFDANGADLASVTLGEGNYSWLTSRGGAIVNFLHTEAPIAVNTHIAATEGDTLTVSSIAEGVSVAAAGGKVDVSQVSSEQPVVLGSYNDATQSETSAQLVLDGSRASTVVANQLAAERGNTTVVGKGSSIEAASLDVSGSGTVLENNGDMSKIASLNVSEGVLKGSGNFGAVTMESGSLVVGNSPGVQNFLSLELKSTVNTVFSINGTTANDGLLTGWGTATYSNLTVGLQLTLEAGTTFTLEFGKAFLASLEEGREYTFDLVSCNALQGDPSSINLAYTQYDVSAGTSSAISSPFSDGRLVSTGTGIRFVGTALAQSIPETSSAALGLAGLLAFALRRRRFLL